MAARRTTRRAAFREARRARRRITPALFATPKLVLMLFEGNTHMYRQFFVDGSNHPSNLKPTFYGDSRAHWDGDTLVVDTVSFFEKSWFDFAGTPHTKAMHLTETFHRVDLRRFGDAGHH